MKDCTVFKKGLCTGCPGLGEKDWIGPEQCSRYKRLNNISGLELCKKILEGEQQKI
jgi:hypothetical protein